MLICMIVTMLPMTAAAGEASAPTWNPNWLKAGGYGIKFYVTCEVCGETKTYNTLDGYDYTVSGPVADTVPTFEESGWRFDVSIKDPSQYYPDGHVKAKKADAPIKIWVEDEGGYYADKVTQLGYYYCIPDTEVTWDTNGGSTIDATPFESGKLIQEPNDPVKEGHTFEGWYADKDLTIPWVFDIDTAASDLTLYAKWTVNSYTISFDTDGGSKVDAIRQEYGTEIQAPEAPTKEGFVFAGWEPEIPETMPGEDTIIHALWDEIISIEVPFSTTVKLGGNKEPGKTTFTLEEAFVKPSGDISGLTYEASVVTDGAGTYNGTMTIRGTRAELWAYLAEGAYFRMVDDGKENWTYDSSVWAVVLDQRASAASLEDSVEEEPWEVSIHPAICETLEDGEIYCTFDWEGSSVEKMSFTNTYTENGVVQNTTIQSKPDVPKTGDMASLTLWIALFAAAAVNAAGLAVYSKKKK